jgi:hypothetical protein
MKQDNVSSTGENDMVAWNSHSNPDTQESWYKKCDTAVILV